MLVNGKPLVMHAYHHAVLWGCERVTVVASPENVKHLVDLFKQPNSELHWVVQPKPSSIVDAIHRGIQTVQTNRVLILCADNTFEFDGKTPDIQSYIKSKQSFFGSRSLPQSVAGRFTRWLGRKRLDTSTHNGPSDIPVHSGGVVLFESGEPMTKFDGCWIGPLLLDTEAVMATSLNSVSIVDLINGATCQGQILSPIPMLCSDMGVPEELVG